MKNCSNCIFSFIGREDGLFCRRNPPIPSLSNGLHFAQYPAVLDSWWCGEWKSADETSVKVVNVFYPASLGDFLMSSAGEEVIINFIDRPQKQG
jgi:hypothetical protein